jgi:hypothetical protein
LLGEGSGGGNCVSAGDCADDSAGSGYSANG